LRAVFDTNVLVSALLKPSSKPAQALRRAARGRFDLYLSQSIIDELAAVLARPFFRERIGDPRVASAFVELLAAGFPLARPATELPITVDPGDVHVIAAALGCRADYLVTGDRRHLLPLGRVGEVEIVDVDRFLSTDG